MTWKLQSIADMAGGQLMPALTEHALPAIHQVSSNSRDFGKALPDNENVVNGIFVALSGERFDGHDFIPQLAKNLSESSLNLCACLVSEAWFEKNRHNDWGISFIVVKDTGVAFLKWGKAWANNWQKRNPKRRLIALSGSNGKTTIKEMIASIFACAIGKEKVLVSKGNLNNMIGLPTTLLQLRDCHQWAVVELGINTEGEMALLAENLSPDIALISNAGRVHLQGLKSVSQVAFEKGKLFENIRKKPKGTALINIKDKEHGVWIIQAKNFFIKAFGNLGSYETQIVLDQSFSQQLTTIYNDEKLTIRLPLIGAHQADNAVAAMAVAELLEVTSECIVSALSKFTNVSGRLGVNKHPNNADIIIIDDTYNANPESMKKAIATLAEIAKTLKANGSCQAFIALGDMGETGTAVTSFHRELHQEISLGQKQGWLARAWVIGNNHQLALANIDIDQEQIALVNSHDDMVLKMTAAISKSQAKKIVVLVKGSRTATMEKVVQGLMALTNFTDIK